MCLGSLGVHAGVLTANFDCCLINFLFCCEFYFSTCYFKKNRYHITDLNIQCMHTKYGSLAQLVEQLAFNQLVAGSNPARPTNIFTVI